MLIAFTGLLVVVGFLQVLVLYVQWRLICRQDEHFTNSERAWIIVSPVEAAPVLGFIPGPGDALDAPGRDRRNAFTCSIKNTGRTPARLVASSLQYRKIDSLKDVSQVPDYGKMLPFDDLLLVVGDSVGDLAYLYPQIVLNKPEVEAIQGQKAFLYAYGKVVYKDVYNETHETKFGYVYHMPVGGDPKPRGFNRGGLPPTYNGAT